MFQRYVRIKSWTNVSKFQKISEHLLRFFLWSGEKQQEWTKLAIQSNEWAGSPDSSDMNDCSIHIALSDTVHIMRAPIEGLGASTVNSQSSVRVGRSSYARSLARPPGLTSGQLIGWPLTSPWLLEKNYDFLKQCSYIFRNSRGSKNVCKLEKCLHFFKKLGF